MTPLATYSKAATLPSSRHTPQRISSPAGAYDASGNLLADGLGGNYTYDANGMVATDNGTTYYYDAMGNRVGKSGSAGATDTIYFGGKPIARLTAGAWTDLIYGTSGVLAEVAGTQTATPVYRLTDHLGTSVGMISSTGVVASFADYAPFGQVFNGSSQDPYLFTGKERDSESGLDHFQFRNYSSAMGRWMSPDPTGGSLANPQSLNRYSYVLNNPLRLIDPYGLWHCTWNAVSGDGSDNDDRPEDGGASSSECFSQGGEAWTADKGDVPELTYNGDQQQNSGGNTGGAGSDSFEPGSLAYNTFGPPSLGTWTAASTTVNWGTGLTIAAYGGALAGIDLGIPVAANMIGRFSATAAGAGITVLGRFPQYADTAKAMGANFLQVADRAWSFLEATGETWTANRAFLDSAISRGDDFILASPPEAAQSWTYYAQELEYMRSQGYVVDPSATRLVVPH